MRLNLPEAHTWTASAQVEPLSQALSRHSLHRKPESKCMLEAPLVLVLSIPEGQFFVKGNTAKIIYVRSKPDAY